MVEAGTGPTPIKGEALVLRYTVVPCPYEQILVAATERGICAVALGNDEDTLVQELEREFPNASDLTRDGEVIGDWVEPIVRYLDGVPAHPTVPLDLQGTDFQRHVWRMLQQIPYGETRSCSEVAEMMGRPKAERAVASACASNKVALVVPCHRVIRRDGGHGGYHWGPEIKACLIQQEQAAPSRAGED